MSSEIPDTQWAQVFEKTGGPLQYKRIPVQKPGPDEVLINIKYTGVCRSDLNALRGDFPVPTKLPLIGGHEGAGIVVALGENVKNFEIGEKAGMKWINSTCLACEFCEQGDEQLCAQAQFTGYTVDGCFQQYVVAKAAHVVRLPRDVPLDQVAPMLCAGVTAYRAVRESGARMGQTLAVVGASGGVGSMAVQFAVAMGLNVVAVASGSESRRFCDGLGATAFIDYTSSPDMIADMKAATDDGLGPHAVILAATSEKPFHEATEYTRPLGTIIALGLPPHAATLRANIFSTVLRRITIKGSYVGSRRDLSEAINLFFSSSSSSSSSGRPTRARPIVNPPPAVVVRPLSELSAVFDGFEDKQDKAEGEGVMRLGRVVLDTSR